MSKNKKKHKSNSILLLFFSVEIIPALWHVLPLGQATPYSGQDSSWGSGALEEYSHTCTVLVLMLHCFFCRVVKRNNRMGAFFWSLSHTLFHIKCSTEGFDLSRRRESWLTEQIRTISCRRRCAAILTAMLGRRVLFSTAAWAIELHFPCPTYRPSFLRELVRWWYLLCFE